MKEKDYIKKTVRFAAVVLAAVMLLSLFSACRHKPAEEDSETWDYVRSSDLPDFGTVIKLNETNLKSDFDKTGRGLVSVEMFIDGDTVHFYNYSKSEILKVRFIGIDTPESTGKVEPWGKPASIYTKTKLRNADEIVLESDTEGEAGFDSTGSRYLAWVWYRNKGENEWRNLNIEILADGLALGKSASSNRYGNVCAEALQSARDNKLNLYSGKNDPLFFYGDAIDLSIKSLVLNKESYSGIKVRFEGVITRKEGQGVYVQSFDEDTNQYYGVYVYGGYSSLAPKFLVAGYKVSITGTADNSENFGFQVSGLSFSMINPTDDDTKVIEKDVYIEPNKVTAKQLLEDETLENTLVTMSGLAVKRIYTTTNESSSSYGAMTLTCSTNEGLSVQVRTSVLAIEGELVTEEYFDGHVISVIGVVEYYEGSPQIKLISLSDCTFED